MNNKVIFKNVGRRSQHKVTLFEICQKKIDISDSDSSTQSYAEQMLTHYENEAKDYLKAKGFEDTTGLFQVTKSGEVKRYIVGMENVLDALPLVAAIEERDRNKGGQTGDFLAASIDYYCQMIQNTWPPTHTDCSAVLDYVVLIQNYHFQLYLLENIQSRYSAGKTRTSEAIKARDMKSLYEQDAIRLFHEFRTNRNGKKSSKEWCYQKIERELKKNNPDKETPKASTIKSWLKARKI